MLRNNSESNAANWVKIRLVGDPARRVNRDAIGARIVATPRGTDRRILREVQGGSGYLSMEPLEKHIGLGAADSVDVVITWSNGDEQIVRGLAANRVHVISQEIAVGDRQ